MLPKGIPGIEVGMVFPPPKEPLWRQRRGRTRLYLYAAMPCHAMRSVALSHKINQGARHQESIVNHGRSGKLPDTTALIIERPPPSPAPLE